MLTERLDKMVGFDPALGVLTAGAGLTLDAMIRSFLPLGWFPAVVPGTKFVSLGGCVAADVHGKNHHREGSFSGHTSELNLLLANGEEIACSASKSPELFWATVGGMGLTGLVAEVTLRLRRVETPMIVARQRSARDVNELMDMFEDPEADDEYSVAWIDCVARHGGLSGRGVYIAGHHATAREAGGRGHELNGVSKQRAFDLPFEMPEWLLSEISARAFNELYFRRQGSKPGPFLVSYDRFFFPLDRIRNWNRLYGRRGFVQYQCVIPTAASANGLNRLLAEIANSGQPSFLAVLKRFGKAGKGLLSFPMAGYTLALDFPLRNGLFELLDRLDDIVMDHGGRVYLAKDARMSAEALKRMYPNLPEWLQIKSRLDPQSMFTSDLARRVGIA
jgi:FAD/FMN-containing dehydrogenase